MKWAKNTQKIPWLRLLLPLALVVVWFAVAAVGGPYFGKISDVASNDLSTFLPESAESTAVSERLGDFRDSKTVPAVIVFERSDGKKLSQNDVHQIEKATHKTQRIAGVAADSSPAILAADNTAAYTVVPLASGGELETIIPAMKDTISSLKPTFEYKVTGPASFARDIQYAFSGIDVTLLLVAVAVVFLILLVVYRSPILPVLVLTCSMAALAASIFVVWHLADGGLIELNGQVQGILFILVIGATTDYSLLYISRYREELLNHPTRTQATIATLRSSFEPIIAAGGTVIVGLLCLLLSDLKSNQALGPVGSIGIMLAILSALSFLPALLMLFGRVAFWPRAPRHQQNAQESYQARHPAWAKIGRLVRRHPRRLWIGITAALVLACIGAFQLKADGVAQSDLVLGYSEAREGQKVLDQHFPSGSGSPAYVLISAPKQEKIVAALDKDNGIDSVAVTATNSPSGIKPVGDAANTLNTKIISQVTKKRDERLRTIRNDIERQLAGAPASTIDAAYQQAAAAIPSVQAIAADANPFTDAHAKIVRHKALLQVTLNDAADSDAARDTILRMRHAVTSVDPTAKVGGTTAIQYDANEASLHDRNVLIPLILLAITIILMLLLRSLVAPIVLLLTTVLSFGATLGISALLFNHVFHFPGADPSVILFGFVFLVALGIDYNIFLMTRVREETLRSNVAKGTIKGLVVTGGVITSAGIVLAATFAALSVIPILFLVQIAFVVAFGVLLDTIIVRSLYAPSLTLEIGRVMWWPSKLSRRK